MALRLGALRQTGWVSCLLPHQCYALWGTACHLSLWPWVLRGPQSQALSPRSSREGHPDGSPVSAGLEAPPALRTVPWVRSQNRLGEVKGQNWASFWAGGLSANGAPSTSLHGSNCPLGTPAPPCCCLLSAHGRQAAGLGISLAPSQRWV